MNRITSKAYRDGAQGQPCTLRCSKFCDGGGETTVFAHISDRHSGAAIKASDISGADACYWCHAKFDGQNNEPFSEDAWHFYALRGLQETLENRIQRGILTMPPDATEARRTSTTKPKPINSRGFAPGSKPIPSRPMRMKP